MAPHSSTLAWKIPWMEETGRFPSPRYLHHPGIECGSPALQTDALPSEAPGKQVKEAKYN